jgi:2-C-methyl-D-erythritol 4-phosphate cytidylyltransferase
MRYWLVMPAAGVGRRFGEQRPKQYAPLQGRTVIEWALAPFLSDRRCAGVVIALAAGDPYWPETAARLPAVTVAPGGAERSGSVRNALAALNGRAAPDDWVLVHDAARPCLATRDLDRLLERVGSHPVGGLLAASASDTLKRAGTAGEVDQTVDRAGLWRALTPQMFRHSRLCEALDKAAAAGRFPTDESQALEWLGERPLLVEGSAANIKITTADDLLLAQALLGARSQVAG